MLHNTLFQLYSIILSNLYPSVFWLSLFLEHMKHSLLRPLANAFVFSLEHSWLKYQYD
jgi:hypothetical protein